MQVQDYEDGGGISGFDAMKMTEEGETKRLGAAVCGRGEVHGGNAMRRKAELLLGALWNCTAL